MERQKNDPVIDEVREARHQISARFGHDPRRLVTHYLEQQEKQRDRLIQESDLGAEATSPTSDCSQPAARAAEPGE